MQLTRTPNKKIHAFCTLEGYVLDNAENIEHLVITSTKDLKWNRHVSNICTKAIRTLICLRRNLATCQPEAKESAYKELVHSVLEYGSSVWDPKIYFFKMRSCRKWRQDLLHASTPMKLGVRLAFRRNLSGNLSKTGEKIVDS